MTALVLIIAFLWFWSIFACARWRSSLLPAEAVLDPQRDDFTRLYIRLSALAVLVLVVLLHAESTRSGGGPGSLEPGQAIEISLVEPRQSHAGD